MKIKLRCSQELANKFVKALHEGTIEISENGELCVMEPIVDENHMIVKDQEDYVRIGYDDILFIESLGSLIQVHTKNAVYQAREALYILEGQLYAKGFLRIHKSYIVNKKAIVRIRSSLYMKFQIVLENQEVLEVSRSYYYKFKEEIGF